MTHAYGFCKNESWGFYNHVTKKYDLKDQKIKIINNQGHVVLDALFKDMNIADKDYKYLIILNYQSENNQDIYSSKIENIENFSIKYRFNNCYLLELND